jgi:hypothetical protein
MADQLVPIEMPPGVSRNGTQYQTQGRWYDTNLVRFVDGAVRPVGGWAHFTTSPVGTFAITFTAGLASSATSGTLATAWPGATGTFNVTFSNGDVRACALTYTATTCTWTPGLSSTATASASCATNMRARSLHAWVTNNGTPFLAIGCSGRLLVSKGDSVLKDITPSPFIPGGDDGYQSSGYGGGAYGTYGGSPPNLYGTARNSGVYSAPTIWHLDNFGEQLVGCAPNPAGDGKVYIWALDYTTPTRAAIVTNAPINCAGMIVTEQRHIMAFGGGGNRRLVSWSAKEDSVTWAPASTNEAGSFELQTVGSFIRAVRIRGQILVLTTTDAHAINYIGQPFIFNRERIGVDCGPVGTGAVAVTGAFVSWMGSKRMWLYDGGAVTPMPCEVSDYVFSNLNAAQAYKTTSAHNGAFGEIWWFYPSGSSNEPNSYVIWNYRENHWAIGSLTRTAWVDAGVFTNPTSVDNSGILQRHEQGNLDDGSPMYPNVYAETGALEMQNGDSILGINQVIPDEKTAGDVTVSFRSRFTPEGTEYSFGPYAVRADGRTDVRLSGRQVVMRVKPTRDTDWRMGKFRLAVNPMSRR